MELWYSWIWSGLSISMCYWDMKLVWKLCAILSEHLIKSMLLLQIWKVNFIPVCYILCYCIPMTLILERTIIDVWWGVWVEGRIDLSLMQVLLWIRMFGPLNVNSKYLSSLGLIVVMVLVTGRYSCYQWSLPGLASLVNQEVFFRKCVRLCFSCTCYRNIVIYSQTVGWQAILWKLS